MYNTGPDSGFSVVQFQLKYWKSEATPLTSLALHIKRSKTEAILLFLKSILLYLLHCKLAILYSLIAQLLTAILSLLQKHIFNYQCLVKEERT